ncbi:Uncharacterised protein [Campylobacter jejuni]|nr:Uncharacterised protein [Campylobacter jejuni]
MEIASLASAVKLFNPVLPYLKKVFIFDTFFSMPDGKKAEAITYITTCTDEDDALEKYKQELKTLEYKISQHIPLNNYILRYYLLSRKKNEKFCKSLFVSKSFYEYKDSEVTIKNNIMWLPTLMFLIGILVGYGTITFWQNIESSPLRWVYLLCGLPVSIQYIIYSSHMLFGYIQLRKHVNDFNLFISITRIKRALLNNVFL